MKERMKKKSFWLAVVGSAVLVLQILGVKIDVPVINEAVSAVCALLIFLGIMTDEGSEKIIDPQTESLELEQENNSENTKNNTAKNDDENTKNNTAKNDDNTNSNDANSDALENNNSIKTSDALESIDEL